MTQLADLVWGMVALVGVLGFLGAAAAAWGVDSRPCIGDNHAGPCEPSTI